MKKHQGIILLITVFLILFSGRVIWMAVFNLDDDYYIKQGQLDLRGVENLGTIALDGEWNFYPYTSVIEEDIDLEQNELSKLIEVPGKWNELISDSGEDPFGYGSYHLRILVDPDEEKSYSIYISSVRSASAVYVNNRFVTRIGKVGQNREEAEPKNLPYTATFTADEEGVIDLVIYASNYLDIRSGGIIRTIKFGEDRLVADERLLSTLLQLAVAIMFFIHGVYAIILFLLGHRDKTLIYFSIMMTSLVLFSLGSSNEKILSSIVSISYNTGFKLIHACWAFGMIGFYSLIRNLVKGRWRKFITLLIWIGFIEIVLSFTLNVPALLMIQPIYIIHSVLAIFLAVHYIPRILFKEKVEKYLVIITFMTIVNQVFWFVYFFLEGTKLMYYPFDLIIGLFCLASIWFRRSSLAQSEVELLAEKLQEEDQLKDEFLANTSHELRNPLHGMLNILNSILERDNHTLDEESKKSIELVLRTGRHMSMTLDDLLDIIHLKDGRPTLNKAPISLVPIVTGIIDMMRHMTTGKNISIHNKLRSDLPHVYADENRVIQVVFNLLHNAVKYTDEGSITISGKIINDYIVVTVTDTGIGMDNQAIKKIFEPYERVVDSHIQTETGIGIGLTISRQLIELHGGSLRVKSVLGKGSQFSFTLPLVKDLYSPLENEVFPVTRPQVDVKAINSFTSHQVSSKDKPNILIVDDDPMNLKVVEMILSDEVYDMTLVTNPHDVMELLHKKKWDLIISDVMMPYLSGYKLTRLIREHYSVTDLPVLLLTARSQTTDVRTGFLSGANDYVTKPVEPLELRSRVNLLIQVKRSIQEQLQMEAAWLQAQIQPHFLFNTLNSIIALSEIDLKKMQTLVDEFAYFLRNKFRFDMINEQYLIEEELSIVKSYLYIEHVRFMDRLHVKWDIKGNYKHLYIPLLTIQPLVENAIRHGLMSRFEGGTITIQIVEYDLYTKIAVIDDGVGMDEETVENVLKQGIANRSGVGLMNTHLRLKRHYGEGLTIKSKLNEGTIVSFKVIHN